MVKQDTYIIKASGDRVLYDPNKVRRSLKSANVAPDVIEDIVKKVTPMVRKNMTTQDLYERVYELLKLYSTPLASKYDLKQAIMELGPSGYPFEKYVAGLLEKLGYKVWVNQLVKGACVTHEIDVIAEHNQTHYMIEAKYHNQPGKKSEIQTALYTYARYQDVKNGWEATPGEVHTFHKGWLITNTKLTQDAIDYAECVGLDTSAWDYPAATSLRKLITTTGTYPITSLQTLKEHQRAELLEQNKVFCLDILSMPRNDIKSMGLRDTYEEAHAVCSLNMLPDIED